MFARKFNHVYLDGVLIHSEKYFRPNFNIYVTQPHINLSVTFELPLDFTLKNVY